MAHSAGVFMLGELFAKLKSADKLAKTNIGAVSLLGPCCKSRYFNEKILQTVGEKLADSSLTVFNLNPTSESSLDPAMSPYGKSLASLVSNSFYDEKPAPIVALDDYWQEQVIPLLDKQHLSDKVDYVLSGEKYRGSEKFKCKASYHGEFDNDADTMNYILKKMIGRTRSQGFDPDLTGFNSEQLNRGSF